MSKTFKIFFLILIALILWTALAFVDAGAIGIGIILSVFAFIDIITGKFKENEKIIWIVVVLIAITIGMLGILLKKPAEDNNSMNFLFGLIAVILSLSYFFSWQERKIEIKRWGSNVKITLKV